MANSLQAHVEQFSDNTPVGTIKPSVRTAIPGWVPCDNRTVGAAGSGADYAGNRYFNLYSQLWGMFAALPNNPGDPFRISAGPGASAAVDFAANVVITVDFLSNETFIRQRGAGKDLGRYEANTTARNGIALGGTTSFSTTSHVHDAGSLAADVTLDTGANQVRIVRESVGSYTSNYRSNNGGTAAENFVQSTGSRVRGNTNNNGASASVSLGSGDAETKPETVLLNYFIKY